MKLLDVIEGGISKYENILPDFLPQGKLILSLTFVIEATIFWRNNPIRLAVLFLSSRLSLSKSLSERTGFGVTFPRSC